MRIHPFAYQVGTGLESADECRSFRWCNAQTPHSRVDINVKQYRAAKAVPYAQVCKVVEGKTDVGVRAPPHVLSPARAHYQNRGPDARGPQRARLTCVGNGEKMYIVGL